MTAAEFARQVQERHARERAQLWRKWITPGVLLMLALLLAGRGVMHATVEQSPQWWAGGYAVFAATALGLVVTTVSVVDLFRDGRDFVKLRRLAARERNER